MKKLTKEQVDNSVGYGAIVTFLLVSLLGCAIAAYIGRGRIGIIEWSLTVLENMR